MILAARGPLQTGPKGGQYYIGPSGRKIYVKPGSKAREPGKKATPRAPRKKTPAGLAKEKARAEAKAARDAAREKTKADRAKAKAMRDEARAKAKAEREKAKTERASAKAAHAEAKAKAKAAREKAKADHAATRAKAKAARDEARAKAKADRDKAKAPKKLAAKDPKNARGEIKGGDAKTKAETDRVLEKLGAEKMGAPLASIDYREDLSKVHPDLKGAAGAYQRGTGTIFMKDRLANNHNLAFADKLGTTTHTVGANVSRLELTLTHEFGHHVHLHGEQATTAGAKANAVQRQIDALVKADYLRSDVRPVSRYSRENRNEHFAESYTAYKLRGDDLKTHDPKTYAMVQEVLRIRGIE